MDVKVGDLVSFRNEFGQPRTGKITRFDELNGWGIKPIDGQFAYGSYMRQAEEIEIIAEKPESLSDEESD